MDGKALPRRSGAGDGKPVGPGGRQPHCQQYHHDAAADRPDRLGRTDRAREPALAAAEAAAELRARKRTDAPADHPRHGASGAPEPSDGTGGCASRRLDRANPERSAGETDRGLLPDRRGPRRSRRRHAAATLRQAPRQCEALVVHLGDHRRRGRAVVARVAPARFFRLAGGGVPFPAGLARVGSGGIAGAPPAGRISQDPAVAAAGAGRGHRRAGRGPGRDSSHADLQVVHPCAAGAAGAALARQPGTACAVRLAHRLGRRRRGHAAHRRRVAGRRSGASALPQRLLARCGWRPAPVPADPPTAQLVRNPAALARLGTQTRQAGDAGAGAGHRRLGWIRRTRSRPAPGAWHPLCADPGQRHRAAAGCAARAGGHCLPPVKRAADRSAGAAGCGGLRHPPAPPHHATDTGWKEHALPSPVRGAGRHGPVQQRGVRCVPGPVRHRQLHRQRPAERRCLPRGARRPPAGRLDPQPRLARRQHCALRLRQRRDAGGGISAAPRRGGIAAAPLDPGRLATAAGDAARPGFRHRWPGTLEDERQPAPLAGAAGLRGAARPVGLRRLAGPGKRHRDGVRRAAGWPPARLAGRAGADTPAHRMATLLPCRAAGAGPRPGCRGLAVQPAGSAGRIAGRCGRAVALAHGREPPQTAGVDPCRASAGSGPSRPAVLHPPALADVAAVRLARGRGALGRLSRRRGAVVRPLGLLTPDQLVVGTQRGAQSGAGLARQGPAVPAGAGP